MASLYLLGGSIFYLISSYDSEVKNNMKICAIKISKSAESLFDLGFLGKKGLGETGSEI